MVTKPAIAGTGARPGGAQPALFDLCGGHPALDFVNSLDYRFGEDGAVERLRDYDDLVRFTRQSGLLDARRARLLSRAVRPEDAARALRSARELREALAAVFYEQLEGRTPPATALRTIGRHFHGASRQRELRWEGSGKNADHRAGMRWDWERSSEADAELPVWILAQSASDLMLSAAMDRVRACGADTCRWLFLDTTKNHTRRWCKMQVCGNRMKARRFQARQDT